MLKRLIILLLPLGLAGCVTERNPMLPLALAPSDAAASSCLTYGDTPTFGDCQGTDPVTVPPATN